MKIISTVRTSQLKTIIIAFSVILLAFTIIKYPDEAFAASLRGLKIWWEVIFPALLPFFITAELLLGFGVVQFTGVLLEPLMKPLFNVPGVGGFVLALGFASGYPMGAKLSARLREQELVTRVEGERLVAFTSTSDPLFLLGAIAVGFFHDAKLGVTIALIHYLSSIIVGLLMRFYKKNESSNSRAKTVNKGNIMIRALREMHHARLKETRRFGRLMGDAVMSSIETLLMIGGFIIFFSVILALLTKVEFTILLGQLIAFILIPLGISPELAQSVIYGLFEVTLGAKAVSESSPTIPFNEKIAIVGAISAWGGISVHAQIAAIIQKTDMRYTPYLVARILHTAIAFTLTLLLWKPLNFGNTAANIPTFFDQFTIDLYQISFWDTFSSLATVFVVIIIVLFTLSIIANITQRKYSK